MPAEGAGSSRHTAAPEVVSNIVDLPPTQPGSIFDITYTAVYELEAKFLYSMVVAGKNADFANSVIRRFLAPISKEGKILPFDYVARLIARGELEGRLREVRSGNYGKLYKGFFEASKLKPIELKSHGPADFERIHGVGPKTSRFFILWTRGDAARCAALDTHVLKWLRAIGYEAPLATPSSRSLYEQLEEIFLREADARKMTARALDATIWDWCANKRHKAGAWPKGLSKRLA